MIKKAIDMGKIVADVESGLGDVPIMEKYQLSPADYMAILKKLRENRAVRAGAVRGRIEALKHSDATLEMRAVPRQYVVFSIPIYDAQDQSLLGLVNDITESGLQVEGIKTRVGEVRSFAIRSDVFPLKSPIVFDAECRWVQAQETNEQYLAGFEITMISEVCLEQLRELIKQLTIGEQL
jgi:hypothetical protein